MSTGFLNKRLTSGIAAGIFGLVIITLGGWWFAVSLGVIVHLALLEYFRMAEFAGIRPATKTTLVACQLLLLITQLDVDGIVSSSLTDAVLPLSGAAICCWLLLQPITGSISDIAASIFGLFYLGFLPSHWLKLRNIYHIYSMNESNYLPELNYGMHLTLCICFMIVAFDIGSYFFGKKYGKKILTPISPGKTIEGALFGTLFSILIGIISIKLLNLNMHLFFGLLLGCLVSLFSLVGDLTESMMKRDAGIKHSGDALPGHGGILDRIDSYLFTSAVIYYVVLIFPI